MATIQDLINSISSLTAQNTHLHRSVSNLTATVAANTAAHTTGGGGGTGGGAGPRGGGGHARNPIIPTETLSDFFRQTGSLLGAIGHLTRSVEARNAREGVPDRTHGLNVLQGIGGQGMVGMMSRFITEKGRGMLNRGAGLRGKASQYQARMGQVAQGHRKAANRLFRRAATQRRAGRPALAARFEGMAKSRLGQANQATSTGASRASKLNQAAGSAEALGSLATKAGVAGLAITATVGVLNKMKNAVTEGTDAQVKSMQQYAQMSGSMAMVMAQRDVREMMRDMMKGEQLAGTTGQLTEAEQRRKDVTAPIEVLADNVTNKVLAWGNDALAAVLEPVAEIASELNKWFGTKKDLDNEPMRADQVFEQAAVEYRRAVNDRNDKWFHRGEFDKNERPR